MSVDEETPHSDDGNPSGPTLSHDGKGGTTQNPEMTPGARYIYYRLYTKDGPLETNNPIYSNDRFIGRIPSRLVRPPHTAASLKKYLCKVEGLSTSDSCTLYQSLSEITGLEDSTRLSFRGAPGPGLSDRDPMALVIEARTAENRSKVASTVDPQNLLERNYQERYVYYITYDEDGGAVSKTSFNENNPHLGRASTLSIPPPHIVASLKYHLIKCEEISGYNIQLFKDEDSELSMDDSDAIALVANIFPGSVEDRPLAIAHESQGPTISPVYDEDLAEVLARELLLEESHCELAQARSALEESQREVAQLRKELAKEKKLNAAFMPGASPAQRKAVLERPSFTKKIVAEVNLAEGNHDSTWHRSNTGEIFYTDGVSMKGKYSSPNGSSEYNCYMAIGRSGKLAFILASSGDFPYPALPSISNADILLDYVTFC